MPESTLCWLFDDFHQFYVKKQGLNGKTNSEIWSCESTEQYIRGTEQMEDVFQTADITKARDFEDRCCY